MFLVTFMEFLLLVFTTAFQMFCLYFECGVKGRYLMIYFNFLAVQVVSHMMPDLPNVGLERDIEQFIVSGLLIFTSKL